MAEPPAQSLAFPCGAEEAGCTPLHAAAGSDAAHCGDAGAELDAMDEELAALDRQRAAVVRRSLRAALVLAFLPTNCLAAVRLFASGGAPLQPVGGGGARAGYAAAGPNLGSYAQAVLAAEWADVGLAAAPGGGGGGLEVRGRALALPGGRCAGAEPDGEEEEVLAADAGEEGLAAGEEGEEGEEGGDVWDAAAAAAAAAVYAGGGSGGSSADRRSHWAWDCASSTSGSQSPKSAGPTPALGGGGGGGGSGGVHASGASTSRRASATAPLIPPPSFLPPFLAAAAMAAAAGAEGGGAGASARSSWGHHSRAASFTSASSSSGKGSASGSASGRSAAARPLSPGQLQVIGTRLWAGGAVPPTREDFATAQKGTPLPGSSRL
jgi:hypothetical protein